MEIRGRSLNSRVHFHGVNGDENDSVFSYDTASRIVPHHMNVHSSLNGSIPGDISSGFLNDGAESNLHSLLPLPPQPHTLTSSSFEPLLQAMDVMLQQEDAMQLAPQIEDSTVTASAIPGGTAINYDFMSLWDEA
jgi:hypothetical protein